MAKTCSYKSHEMSLTAISITTFIGRQLRQIYDLYKWLRMYFLIKFARREFQERLDKYIKGISGTLANITYRQAELE